MTRKQDATTSRVVRRKRERRDRSNSSREATAHAEHVLGGAVPPVGSQTGRHSQHPEDRVRDEQLRQDMTDNAGDSVLQRHRGNLTGIENEEDGVPDDAEGLDDAAEQELADQRQRDDLVRDDRMSGG